MIRFRLLLLCVTTAAYATQPTPNVPVTTYLSDSNASAAPYTIQSDGQSGPAHGVVGEYDNAQQGVTSILNANTYNRQPPGDWTLDLLGSTPRTVRLTLGPANEIPPGQPGYTVPPHPPFVGTDNLISKFEEKCTAVPLDMGTMNAVGQTIHCPALLRFNWGATYYRLLMTGSWGGSYPETTQVQIQCNQLGANGYCNDWFVDPIPVVNPDGSTSPGRAIARLVNPSHTEINDGDFYVTFHVHVTRP